MTDIRLTLQTLRVLSKFKAGVELTGSQLIDSTATKSGSVYPILHRLEEAKWLTSRWENIDPSQEGRPRRRFYRLTARGRKRREAAIKAAES